MATKVSNSRVPTGLSKNKNNKKRTKIIIGVVALILAGVGAFVIYRSFAGTTNSGAQVIISQKLLTQADVPIPPPAGLTSTNIKIEKVRGTNYRYAEKGSGVSMRFDAVPKGATRKANQLYPGSYEVCFSVKSLTPTVDIGVGASASESGYGLGGGDQFKNDGQFHNSCMNFGIVYKSDGTMDRFNGTDTVGMSVSQGKAYIQSMTITLKQGPDYKVANPSNNKSTGAKVTAQIYPNTALTWSDYKNNLTQTQVLSDIKARYNNLLICINELQPISRMSKPPYSITTDAKVYMVINGENVVPVVKNDWQNALCATTPISNFKSLSISITPAAGKTFSYGTVTFAGLSQKP